MAQNGYAEFAQPAVSIIAAPDSEADCIEEQDYPELQVVRLDRSTAAGVVEAMELGLRQAESELVCYLGPGERLLPGAVTALAGALRSPAVVAAYSAFDRVNENGETVETVVPEELDFWEILRFQYCPEGPVLMFRRDAVLEAMRPDPDLPHCRELVFWLEVSRLGELRRLNAPLASRRVALEERRAAGGVGAARERVRLLERFIDETELPADPSKGAHSPARNAFISAAEEIESGFNGPEERFFVVDRLSSDWPDPDSLDPDANLALLEAHFANLEQRLTRQRAVFGALEAALEWRESVLADPGGFDDEGRRWSVRRLARRLREGFRG